MSKRKGLPNMKQELRGVKQLFQELPDVAGQIAVNNAHDSFEKEQFQDKGKSGKWATRKKAPDKTKSQKNILVGSGDLRASIDYDTGINEVAVGSDKVYAKVHNEGGKAGRGTGFTMPKRQFMGPIANHLLRYIFDFEVFS